MDKKTPAGFIALKSLRTGPPDPAGALEELRRIYFNTTRQTIDNDMAHAIELLKSLPEEDMREKATVYMHGLAEMAREWGRKRRRKVEEVEEVEEVKEVEDVDTSSKSKRRK